VRASNVSAINFSVQAEDSSRSAEHPFLVAKPSVVSKIISPILTSHAGLHRKPEPAELVPYRKLALGLPQLWKL
jgi:hypothetical protein